MFETFFTHFNNSWFLIKWLISKIKIEHIEPIEPKLDMSKNKSKMCQNCSISYLTAGLPAFLTIMHTYKMYTVHIYI